MYCDFFGFSEKPFDVTPDPKFLYVSPSHREALAALVYGIRERRGFLTIVGEVGTGKTTLLKTVLDRLDEKISAAFVFNPHLTFDELLTAIVVDLGLAKPGETFPAVEAIRRLNDFAIRQLARGGNVVVVIDEAQNLNRSTLENLRLLSNLETYKHKLIQIVLSGQPELDVKLSRPELRQLDQRISLKRYIAPLREGEAYEYVQHRLRAADYNGRTLFSRQAQRMIWEYSQGVPRKINVLCDNALLVAYALREKTIEARVVEEVVRDLAWSPFWQGRETQNWTPVRPRARSRTTTQSRFAMPATMVVGASITLVTALLLKTSPISLQESGLLTVWNSIRALTAIEQLLAGHFPAEHVEQLSREESRIDKTPEPLTVPQQKSGVAGATVDEVPPGQLPSGNQLDAMEDQEPRANLAPSLSETREPQEEGTQVVVVKRGDNLFEIMLQAYGKYDRGVLNAVLRENPEIQSPNKLKVGQRVRLPHVR
jgi:general secretion pathway protein A